MLQQILSSMHIDPDLLANLSEDDRQKLFHKMRVEQVRRWEAWEEKNLQEEKEKPKPKLPPKPEKKKVHFMVGDDGNPLVWMIDEAKFVSSIEDKDNTGFNSNNSSVNSIVERFNGLSIKSPSLKRKSSNRSRVTRSRGICNGNEDADDKEVQAALAQAKILSRNSSMKDDQEKAERLKKLQSKLKTKDNTGSCETRSESSDAMPEVKRVYALLQNTQKNATDLQNSIRKSIENDESLKEIADPETVKQIRQIARKAREEIEEINSHSAVVSRNQRNISAAGSRVDAVPEKRERKRPEKPLSKEAILEWYNTEEKARGTGVNAKTQETELWFHGMITRQEAESLLSKHSVGTFLVRLSEKLWGYAISYRAEDKCKHYLIDASHGNYHLVGESSKKFFKLADMIRYYEVQSITPSGHDFLLKPCPNNASVSKVLS